MDNDKNIIDGNDFFKCYMFTLKKQYSKEFKTSNSMERYPTIFDYKSIFLRLCYCQINLQLQGSFYSNHTCFSFF
jgi:hypothetical protein